MTLLLTQIFGLLTLLVWVGIVGLATSRTAREVARPHAVGAAAAITGVATLGSLYLSEVAGYVPCELCWWQRIFMYTLAVILTVGLIRRRPAAEVLAYAAPLALFGIVTSAWHVVIQRLPVGQGSCDPDNPCSAIIVERFGFVTIPTMAGTAFVAVVVLWGLTRGTDATARTTHMGETTTDDMTDDMTEDDTDDNETVQR